MTRHQLRLFVDGCAVYLKPGGSRGTTTRAGASVQRVFENSWRIPGGNCAGRAQKRGQSKEKMKEKDVQKLR